MDMIQAEYSGKDQLVIMVHGSEARHLVYKVEVIAITARSIIEAAIAVVLLTVAPEAEVVLVVHLLVAEVEVTLQVVQAVQAVASAEEVVVADRSRKPSLA